eukprot:10323115-Karenia_brevis.AAC.1
MAHCLIPYFCLSKIQYAEGSKGKRHQQVFVRESCSFPMVGVEWYATYGPDPTPLRGSQKEVISCSDVSHAFPDDILTDNVTFQQVAGHQQHTLQ